MQTARTFRKIGTTAALVAGGALAGLGASTPVTAPLLALSGASAQSSSAALWSRSELYFGTGKPDGSRVTEQEFRAFVDREVTPRFPDGLTVTPGYGQFRNAAGKIVKEQSFVLVLVYQGGDANAKLEAIRTSYKRAHRQESVLRVDDTTRVSF